MFEGLTKLRAEERGLGLVVQEEAGFATVVAAPTAAIGRVAAAEQPEAVVGAQSVVGVDSGREDLRRRTEKM